jgi:hypothetical protein
MLYGLPEARGYVMGKRSTNVRQMKLSRSEG